MQFEKTSSNSTPNVGFIEALVNERVNIDQRKNSVPNINITNSDETQMNSHIIDIDNYNNKMSSQNQNPQNIGTKRLSLVNEEFKIEMHPNFYLEN